MNADPVIDHDLAYTDPELTDETRETWRCNDDQAAAWAMRKLAHRKQLVANAEGVRDRERERIDAWFIQESAKHDRDIAFFTGVLVDYARRQREEGRKSIDLPTGIVRTRAAGDRVVVRDAAAFVQWALYNAPDLLRIKHEPIAADVNGALTAAPDGTVVSEDGEVVPGVEYLPPAVTVSVEVGR